MKKFLIAPALVAACTMTLAAETMTVGGTSYTVTRNTKTLAEGVTYTELLFPGRTYTGYTGGGRVHVVEADLTNPKVAVEMINNGTMSGTKTLANHAASVNKTGYQVVAGANANFWITSEQPWKSQTPGWPHGVAIRNGSMFTDCNVGNDKHCGGPTITGMLLIDGNGKAWIDKTKDQLTWNGVGSGIEFHIEHIATGHYFDIDRCNRVVQAGTAGIYNRNYGTDRAFKPVNSTSSNTWEIVSGVCTEIILDLAPGEQWNLGGKTKFKIVDKRVNAGTGTLGNHDLAIVGRDSYASVLASGYNIGDEVYLNTKVNFANDGSPAKIMQATSGNILAMKNGTKGSFTSYDTNANERTLYATNAAGTKLWILVCEHNIKQTKQYFGWSTSQMCDIAKAMGAVNAIQVDCGGSAQMYAGGKQVSTSYDSSGIRGVYNGIFIVSKDATTPNPGPDPVADPSESEPAYNNERANFAYGLSMTGDKTNGYRLTYKLTGAAKSVSVNLINTADNSVKTLVGGTAKGVNTVTVAPEALEAEAQYRWEVKVSDNPIKGSGKFFHASPAKLDARGGVGIVTNPESDAYGRIVVSNGYAQGIDLYEPDMTKVGNYAAGFATLNAGNRSDTYRIAMRDGKTAVACAFSDKGAGFWQFDPANPSNTLVNMSKGTNDGTGCIKNGDAVTGTGASGLAFTGTGTGTRLWVFAEDWPSGNSAYKGILARWDVGNATEITGGVNAAYEQYIGTGKLGNQNCDIVPYGEGVFLCQKRANGSNSAGTPCIIYTDIYGTEHYNSGGDADIPGSGAAMAISADGKLIALSGHKDANIRLYDVTWNGMKPTLKFKRLLRNSANPDSNYETAQLAFDPAGNLYGYMRGATDAAIDGLHAWALVNDNPTATTPAKAALVLTGPDKADDPVVPPSELEIKNLTEVWNYSTNRNNLAEAAWFNGNESTTRDMCFANNQLYVLNTGAGAPAAIRIIDAATGYDTGRTLKLDGISGGTFHVAGIKALGNTVIGANMAGATGALKVYKWANDDAAPEVILNTTDHGGIEVGRSFNASGDMTKGKIAFGCYNSTDKTHKIVWFNVNNGVVDPTPNVVTITAKAGGNASNQSVFIMPDGTFLLNHKDTHPAHFDATGNLIGQFTAGSTGALGQGAAISAFDFGSRTYAASTATLGGASAWSNGVLKVSDITDGVADATIVGDKVYPEQGLGSASWGGVGVNSVAHQVTDNGNTANIWTLVPHQGVAMYQYKNENNEVSDIAVDQDDSNGPAEYYNLQGVRVDADNLTPGLYIRRQGKRSVKVLVR